MVEQRMESLSSAAYRAVPDNLEAAIARKVAHEGQELCSFGVNSVLRQSSVDALASFSPQEFVEELVSVAPTFYAIVCAATGFDKAGLEGSDRSDRSLDYLSSGYSHITSSVSCLMFHRNRIMSALQYLISTILRDSGAKKTAFRRLNRMGLTVSAESQRLKPKQMIAQFDQPIRCWKKSLENLSNKTDSEEGDESDSVKSTILSDDELPGTSSEESNDCQSIIRQCEFKPNHLPYYRIVGDNIDFEVKTKFMILEKKNRSLHWFNLVAVDEQISPP